MLAKKLSDKDIEILIAALKTRIEVHYETIYDTKNWKGDKKKIPTHQELSAGIKYMTGLISKLEKNKEFTWTKDLSYNIPEANLKTGFKVSNFRAIEYHKADGELGIMFGGSYMEFNRISDSLGITFTFPEIDVIIFKLLGLKLKMEVDDLKRGRNPSVISTEDD